MRIADVQVEVGEPHVTEFCELLGVIDHDVDAAHSIGQRRRNLLAVTCVHCRHGRSKLELLADDVLVDRREDRGGTGKALLVALANLVEDLYARTALVHKCAVKNLSCKRPLPGTSLLRELLAHDLLVHIGAIAQAVERPRQRGGLGNEEAHRLVVKALISAQIVLTLVTLDKHVVTLVEDSLNGLRGLCIGCPRVFSEQDPATTLLADGQLLRELQEVALVTIAQLLKIWDFAHTEVPTGQYCPTACMATAR